MFGGIFITLCIVTAYLIGSISCAIIVCRLLKLPDPRTQGSHNPGATNVLRFGGKRAAALTLLGDGLKGFIPVFLAKHFGFPTVDVGLVMFAAFLGHLYPCFFHFKGGKGVATALGCWLALAWPVGVAFILIWLLIAKVFRISSLAALVATGITPFCMLYFTNWTLTIVTILMCGFLMYRHKSNIEKLISGQENRLNGAATAAAHSSPNEDKPE